MLAVGLDLNAVCIVLFVSYFKTLYTYIALCFVKSITRIQSAINKSMYVFFIKWPQT